MIMSQTKIGSFGELVDMATDELQPIMLRLREIILDIDPQVCEVVRLGDRAATYGVGTKKMSEGYAYILPYKKWVNLGFYHGATLPDESKALTGSGKKMRHIKIHSLERANQPDIKKMIQNAVHERKTSQGIS